MAYLDVTMQSLTDFNGNAIQHFPVPGRQDQRFCAVHGQELETGTRTSSGDTVVSMNRRIIAYVVTRSAITPAFYRTIPALLFIISHLEVDACLH